MIDPKAMTAEELLNVYENGAEYLKGPYRTEILRLIELGKQAELRRLQPEGACQYCEAPELYELEICAGRMRGCNEHISEMQETHAIPELQPQHELIEEVEAWIADMKDKE